MKRFLTQLISIIVIAFLLEQFLPWWSIGIAAFTGALVFPMNKGWKNFGTGFLAILLLWVGAAIHLDSKSGFLISNRLGSLAGLPVPTLLLPLIGGIIGGLVAGFAALAGGHFLTAFGKK